MLTPVTHIDFGVAFEGASGPAMLLDCDLTVLACNLAYEQAVRKERAVLLGRPTFDVLPGSSDHHADVLRESYQRVLDTRKPQHISQFQYGPAAEGFTKSQARFWTVSNTPLFETDGSLRGILHCAADATAFAATRQRDSTDHDVSQIAPSHLNVQQWTQSVQSILQSERERLQQLFKQAPGFICVLQGPQHIFELANDAYYQLVGHRDVIGCAWAEVFSEFMDQGFQDRLDAVYSTGTPFIGRALPIDLHAVAGAEPEQRFIDLICQPIFDAQGAVTGIYAQGNDVTEAYQLAQEVAYQAAHDSLTGLYNRREFGIRTERIEGSGPHALLYMDIDHFKIINDRRGHAAGDSLLTRVAELLLARCDGKNDILARFGGDEFALVRPNCGPDDAMAFADRLRTSIEDVNFIWQGKRYSVTLSVGVVNFGDPEGLAFDSALGSADAACFLAKEKGRNRVQMSLATDEEVRQQLHDMDSVSRLKDAMREDRVLLYSQKIVPLQTEATGQCVFHEVLARMQDVDGTIISPGAFIPAAERFGLIEELDRHIVRKMFTHIQAHAHEPPDTSCYFINLSGITLSAPGFLGFIARMQAEYPDVRSSDICFEVTETAALSNIYRTAEAMRQLVAKGFTFALDDFGSGMASFTYLRHLPVQYVKIDGEFVKAILDQAASAIIVEAVTRVAQSMNMRTIAESVEFDELIPRLKALGIDYAQGYAIHLPAPI